MRLNHIYPKEQILTEYVDRVGFGYLSYGLKSAAKYYFNREPKDLTKAEQIALLILPKDSKKYDPYRKPKSFRTRLEEVARILEKERIITADEQKEILAERLNWNTEHGNPLPYAVDFLKIRPETPQERAIVETTFNRRLTEQIDTIAKNALHELAWKNVSDYGIIIAERDRSLKMETGPKNPLLRVMIGGTDYTESVA